MLQRDVVVVKGTLAHVVSKRFLNSGTRVLENGVASEGEWPVTLVRVAVGGGPSCVVSLRWCARCSQSPVSVCCKET